MAFYWRWLLILSALVLGGGQLFAAGSAKENRIYSAAVSAFQDEMWSRAEIQFGQFIAKYPQSTNVPQAVLLEAQAEFKQGKLAQAITLLSETNHVAKAKAAGLADQYAYWIGEAQYANNDLANAAETFTNLAQNFPDSSLRLRAAVEAVAAYARLGDWREHDALLEDTNGIFQQAAQLDPGNELVLDGQLSLENSKYKKGDFSGVSATYDLLTNQWQTLNQAQQSQGTYLLYLANMEQNDFAAALRAASNLVQIASSPTNQDWLATAWASQAVVLGKMDRLPEAMSAWRENLDNSAPQQQRQAILKIAELAVAQNQFSNAEQALEKFLVQFSGSPSADIALLSLGELHLKDYATDSTAEAATNQLQAASSAFDQFLDTYTNSPLVADVHLDRGWCEWFAADITNGLADFEMAARLLPPSENLAVARFKLGDAFFAETNFDQARDNYQAVVDDFADFPAVQALNDRAQYQILRASMELKDEAGASNALAQILEKYPSSDLGPDGALLYGEGLAAADQPVAARTVFQKFLAQWPDSQLRPQVEFAIAHTYQLEQDWPDAIAGYQTWLAHFPTNQSRPQAAYELAWSDAQAGNGTNAFALFTNFVAQYPTNDLTPLAQWWVAGYFYRLGGTNYVDAERDYELVFQDFPTDELVYPARMMAGLAAVGLQDYKGAIQDYFSKLEGDTNCPMDLRVQAAFAHGSALMRMDSVDTNNPVANFQLAANVFTQICQLYPANDYGARAWGEIGDCELQLTNYDAATNAYAEVLMTNLQADISMRSQAQIGIGIALKKKAALTSGDAQKTLLLLALDNYLDVFDATNLRDGENAAPFWVKKAGLQALPLIETLGAANPNKFIDRMEQLLPELSGSLEKTRAALPPPKS